MLTILLTGLLIICYVFILYRYYFAVAELSSVAAAEAIYSSLDGVELAHSSMVVDLRFIPDDVRSTDIEFDSIFMFFDLILLLL